MSFTGQDLPSMLRQEAMFLLNSRGSCLLSSFGMCVDLIAEAAFTEFSVIN